MSDFYVKIHSHNSLNPLKLIMYFYDRIPSEILSFYSLFNSTKTKSNKIYNHLSNLSPMFDFSIYEYSGNEKDFFNSSTFYKCKLIRKGKSKVSLLKTGLNIYFPILQIKNSKQKVIKKITSKKIKTIFEKDKKCLRLNLKLTSDSLFQNIKKTNIYRKIKDSKLEDNKFKFGFYNKKLS